MSPEELKIQQLRAYKELKWATDQLARFLSQVDAERWVKARSLVFQLKDGL